MKKLINDPEAVVREALDRASDEKAGWAQLALMRM